MTTALLLYNLKLNLFIS